MIALLCLCERVDEGAGESERLVYRGHFEALATTEVCVGRKTRIV